VTKLYPRNTERLLGPPRRFVETGEQQQPKQGEWYLSGAIPEAYQAPNDLNTVNGKLCDG
jgi:hypothetical protein